MDTTKPSPPLPTLLRSLADIARGRVDDRAERYAAAVAAELAADELARAAGVLQGGLRALAELSGAGLLPTSTTDDLHVVLTTLLGAQPP